MAVSRTQMQAMYREKVSLRFGESKKAECLLSLAEDLCPRVMLRALEGHMSDAFVVGRKLEVYLEGASNLYDRLNADRGVE